MGYWKKLLLVLLCGVCTGCATKSPQWGPQQKMPEQSSEKAMDSGYRAPGSLWNHTADTLFVDNKATRPGDIVTVAIYEQASASKSANTDTGRSSSISAGLPNFFGLEGSAKVGDTLDLSNLMQGSFSNEFSGSGDTSRQGNLSATITTQVVSALPNGNLRIQGRKRVVVNNEEQFIGLSGVVRPEDIDANNMVDSQYVLDAEIIYTGRGAVSDKQQPGWFTRIVDNAWPF